MIALVAAMSLAIAVQAEGDPADPLTQWMDCNVVQVMDRVDAGGDSREAIADVAAAACVEEERRFEAQIAAESGAGSAAREIRRLRQRVRRLNLDLIDEWRDRRLAMIAMSARFGRCVADQALVRAGQADPAETLVDRAMAACAEEEAAALATAVPDRDPAATEDVRQAMRGPLRAELLRQIAEARAAR